MAQEQPATTQPRETMFDALIASLQGAAAYNRDDVVPPAAILWTDERREWESLVPRLRVVLPQLLVLGPYDKANRTGPAIWLRCVLAGRISGVSLSPATVPIIYLPGVSRPTLRATEDCPAELRPLAELQYRGVFWSQYNGKDWTIAAFLQSDKGGLGLHVARDRATAASVRRALERLLDVAVAELQAKAANGPLNSDDFDALISDDPVDDLLTWLSDPKGTRERWDTSRWETLYSRCKSDYGFDPVKDGELVGAERLGRQAKPTWRTAWKRFAAVPSRYPGLVDLLRRAKPITKAGEPFPLLTSEAWPQDNEAEEAELRQALCTLASMPVTEARAQLQELEAKHGPRRSWVWARLGRAPLAQAIQHLSLLAEVTETPLTGASAAALIEAYTTHGWRAMPRCWTASPP
ncbi:MAG TPA: BREX-1 system phosphatase PglZ type B [Alphaproteobacteria bacterium]|nr:BREX-1 system phosphatase PglZ type B [Alphaproteobacteria bacterium]